MTTDLFTLALFILPLFLIGAFLVTGLPVALSLQNYFANRGRQSVTCPDSKQPADVTVDRKFAFWTALRGQEHSRLESCSRWPEKGDCGQECLAQVEPSPENIERLLTKWYEGKSCAICTRALTPADWRRSRLAVLNADNKPFELREMTLERLSAALENMRPLCWNCHQEDRERWALPARPLKGQRRVISVEESA
jgi:hypothetical protein